MRPQLVNLAVWIANAAQVRSHRGKSAAPALLVMGAGAPAATLPACCVTPRAVERPVRCPKPSPSPDASCWLSLALCARPGRDGQGRGHLPAHLGLHQHGLRALHRQPGAGQWAWQGMSCSRLGVHVAVSSCVPISASPDQSRRCSSSASFRLLCLTPHLLYPPRAVPLFPVQAVWRGRLRGHHDWPQPGPSHHRQHHRRRLFRR